MRRFIGTFLAFEVRSVTCGVHARGRFHEEF